MPFLLPVSISPSTPPSPQQTMESNSCCCFLLTSQRQQRHLLGERHVLGQKWGEESSREETPWLYSLRASVGEHLSRGRDGDGIQKLQREATLQA